MRRSRAAGRVFDEGCLSTSEKLRIECFRRGDGLAHGMGVGSCKRYAFSVDENR